jgi:endoglucanase
MNYASNTQYVTTATFLLTTYAKYLSGTRRTVNCGGRQFTAGDMYSFARQQVY